MATMIAPKRIQVLEKALSPASAFSLPAFLVPALHTTPARSFSFSPGRQSKLGRTPLSIPPGVELTIGEPKVKKDVTTYMKIAKRTVTIAGPLGKLASHGALMVPS
jgi:large subunit ribosomal protein L6